MGAARSRSHRAGGRPSTRTRMLLLHAVRVAVAAEARGGPRQGAHTFVFGVTRLTPLHVQLSDAAESSLSHGLSDAA